jgi:hypothetical protein
VLRLTKNVQTIVVFVQCRCKSAHSACRVWYIPCLNQAGAFRAQEGLPISLPLKMESPPVEYRTVLKFEVADRKRKIGAEFLKKGETL